MRAEKRNGKMIKRSFKALRTGDYRGGYDFAPYHFYLPEELRESFEKRKIKTLGMAGLEDYLRVTRKKRVSFQRAPGELPKRARKHGMESGKPT